MQSGLTKGSEALGCGYKHIVFGRDFLIQLALVTAVVAPFIVLFANSTSVWLTVAVVGGIFVLLFHSMTVEVEGQMLRFWFGPGLLKREIPITDIENAEKKYTPWFWGYGFRGVPDGWLYRVSGFETVLITLKNGKKFRLGTDEPDALIKALPLASSKQSSS